MRLEFYAKDNVRMEIYFRKLYWSANGVSHKLKGPAVHTSFGKYWYYKNRNVARLMLARNDFRILIPELWDKYYKGQEPCNK